MKKMYRGVHNTGYEKAIKGTPQGYTNKTIYSFNLNLAKLVLKLQA